MLNELIDLTTVSQSCVEQIDLLLFLAIHTFHVFLELCFALFGFLTESFIDLRNLYFGLSELRFDFSGLFLHLCNSSFTFSDDLLGLSLLFLQKTESFNATIGSYTQTQCSDTNLNQ